jgi:hypothetical protein
MAEAYRDSTGAGSLVGNLSSFTRRRYSAERFSSVDGLWESVSLAMSEGSNWGELARPTTTALFLIKSLRFIIPHLIILYKDSGTCSHLSIVSYKSAMDLTTHLFFSSHQVMKYCLFPK